MQTRIITGLLFGTVMIVGLLAGKKSAVILLLLIGLGCLYEYVKIVKGNQITHYLWLALAVAATTAGLCYFAQEVPIQSEFLTTHVITLVLAIQHLWKPFIRHGSYYIGVALLYIFLPIFMTIYTLEVKADQAQFLLYIFILIWISDSSAYFVGSRWGKRKLFEKISPKKTWEGFLGAGLFTVTTAIIIGMFTGDISPWYWLMAGVWVWVMGTLGDLFESSIKREFGVKDSGTILPGHGGFLDRFDSFLFVTYVGTWILVWLP